MLTLAPNKIRLELLRRSYSRDYWRLSSCV